MNEDTDPLVFPDMPDEAVVALNEFLETLHNQFQNHYCAQLHRWYHALTQREHYNDSVPSRPLPDPPF